MQHLRTEHIIKYGSNILEFFSLDDEQKVRGRKRTHLWLNEANECNFDEWQQLIFRTADRAYLDFNPDDVNCWINTELEQTRAHQKGDVDVVVPADAIEPIDKNDSSGSATGCTVEVAAGASGCDDLVAAHGPSHLSPAMGGFLRRPRSSTRWRGRFKV